LTGRFVSGIEKVGSSAAKTAGELGTLAKTSAMLADVLHTVVLVGKSLWMVLGMLKDMSRAVLTFGIDAKRAFEDTQQRMDDFMEAFTGKTPFEEMEKFRRETEVAAAAGKGFGNTAAALDTVADATDRVADATDRATKAQDDYNAAVEALALQEDAERAAMDHFNDFAAELQDDIAQWNEGLTDLELRWRKIANMPGISDEMRELMDELLAVHAAAKPGTEPPKVKPVFETPKAAATAAGSLDRTGAFEGLGALYSRIATAAGGRGDPQERTAKAAEKTGDEVKKQTKAVETQTATLKDIHETLKQPRPAVATFAP